MGARSESRFPYKPASNFRYRNRHESVNMPGKLDSVVQEAAVIFVSRCDASQVRAAGSGTLACLVRVSVRKSRLMSRLPRYWPIVAVFVAMTILQASVAALSIQLLSTVRDYVAGESLYSQAQKDAQIYLLDYAEKHREADYVRFRSALAIPLGDRAAREALQRQEPDIEAARQ